MGPHTIVQVIQTMSVIAFNGSPKKDGNTARLIRYALGEIERAGIRTELVQVGGRNVYPCTGCMKCFQNQDRECIQKDDLVNDCIRKMIDADAIIIGSPTYFAGVTPEIKAFMDRAFFVAMANGALFRRKLGAGIAANRRAGAVSALDTLNHFFSISGMFTAGSCYWNLGVGLAHPGMSIMTGRGSPRCASLVRTSRGSVKNTKTHESENAEVPGPRGSFSLSNGICFLQSVRGI